ncbi:hypothetical protein RKD55_000147 [Rossellomorea marisflavi]
MFRISTSLSIAQSDVQRRPPDSYGNSGQDETLQATPKRLTARPMESGGRSETERSRPHHILITKTGGQYLSQIRTSSNPIKKARLICRAIKGKEPHKPLHSKPRQTL